MLKLHYNFFPYKCQEIVKTVIVFATPEARLSAAGDNPLLKVVLPGHQRVFNLLVPEHQRVHCLPRAYSFK